MLPNNETEWPPLNVYYPQGLRRCAQKLLIRRERVVVDWLRINDKRSFEIDGQRSTPLSAYLEMEDGSKVRLYSFFFLYTFDSIATLVDTEGPICISMPLIAPSCAFCSQSEDVFFIIDSDRFSEIGLSFVDHTVHLNEYTHELAGLCVKCRQEET